MDITKAARAARDRFDRLVPPRFATLHEGIDDKAITWRAARPSAPYQLPHRTRFGHNDIQFETNLLPDMPELGVAVIPNGVIHVGGGWVYDRKKRLLNELSWYGSDIVSAVKSDHVPHAPRATRKLRGTALSLGSNWGTHYGHYAIDALPRLQVFLEAGGTLDEIDTFLVPLTPAKGAARDLLDRSGIPLNRVEYLNDGRSFQAERLFVPTLAGARRQYVNLLPKFLRSTLAEPAGPPNRKLLVTRKGFSRNPVQNSDMEAIAVAAGFEIYDPMRSADQAADFQSASAVVGVSGSGLTNIGYCQPGTRVVEIFSDAHPYGYYYSLSGAADLEYGYLVGTSRGEKMSIGASSDDFDVDLDALRHAFAWASSPPRHIPSEVI